MKNVRLAHITAFAISLFLCAHSAFANEKFAATVHGYESFRAKDWESAAIFFRQSVNTPSERSPEILYMLIVSEMNAQEYKNVASDCDFFLQSYPDNQYRPAVMFQKARSAFCLKNYSGAILLFSDFCNANVGNALYASALYWIAESFYALYDFDSAKDFYERIVANYADEPKYEDSKRRLEEIAHWEREEKLLYLLKITGEEYLAAKEEYERELKLYKNSDIDGLRQRLREYGLKISELEARNAELEAEAEKARLEAKAANDAAAAASVSKPSVSAPPMVVPTKAGSAVEVPVKNGEKGSDAGKKNEPPEKKSAETIMTESELEALKAKALRIQELLGGNSSEEDGTEK